MECIYSYKLGETVALVAEKGHNQLWCIAENEHITTLYHYAFIYATINILLRHFFGIP